MESLRGTGRGGGGIVDFEGGGVICLVTGTTGRHFTNF